MGTDEMRTVQDERINAPLGRVRATNVAVEKHEVLHILRLCL
jgi:hypothetical protein